MEMKIFLIVSIIILVILVIFQTYVTMATIDIHTTDAEYVAVISFGGFASTDRISKHKTLLQQHLKEKGIAYYGNFRFLGYNPPYQLFGRRNEVIVSVDESQHLNSNQ